MKALNTPKYSIKFLIMDMFSARVNVDTYLSGKILKDMFVTAAEATSQSPPGTRANLHNVEAAEEGLLLGESVEYTTSQVHRPTPISMTHPSIPLSATRAKLRFSPKIIFLEINRVNNIIT
jgi:hypothetical protein